MEVFYQGKNITPYVNVIRCIHRDVSHGRADTLEITFDRAAQWHRWANDMAVDDEIAVTRDGYSTGTLYLNTILPEGDRYRLLATGLKSGAARKAWDTYRNMTLETVMHQCAAACGMKERLYGIDGKIRYAFLMRQNEGCAAFLERLALLEGMALKAVNGAFTGIYIPWAQERNAAQRICIDADQEGVKYTKRGTQKYGLLTVRTPWAEAAARDRTAGGAMQYMVSDAPAVDAAQAGRWARGLLLHHNRQAETLTVESTFNPNITAMTRADVEGNTGACGRWMVDEAEHDLLNGSTTARYLRVIDTIE